MKKKINKNVNHICVIGVGRFGSSVVKQLIKMKKFVLAIDIDKNKLTEVSKITETAVLDATDVESLKAIGIDLFKTVIVASSNNIETVASLIELGIKNIIAKATTEIQERVLKHLGVDLIIRPEYEAGLKTALIATNTDFIKYTKSLLEIGHGHALATTALTNLDLVNKKLKNLKLTTLNISVVAIRRDEEVILPVGDTILQYNDLITIVGKNENILKAFEKFNDTKTDLNQ